MQESLKLSEKYEPLFEILEGDYPHIDTVIITGGRNSQKSFAVGTWSCIASKDYHNNILYTRYTLTSAEDSIIPEFKEKIEILNVEDYFYTTKDRIVTSDSKIVFKGIKTSAGNQTASLKSLKGFNVFILEEAEEMPSFEDWDKITKSIRSKDKQNINILILNPTTKEHWIFKEFFEGRGINPGFNGINKNVLYIHSTYLDMDRELIADNIWNDFEEKRIAYEDWIKLPQDHKDKSALRRDAMYYKHIILGGWLDKAEGVVYTNWEIGDFVDNGNAIYGQDFGFSVDPTTLVKVCIDKSRKVIYVHECFYKPKLTTSEIFELNNRYAGQSLIYGDSAEPRLIEELRRRGNNIKAVEKGAGSVSASIALLQDYKLVISPTSVNTIKELNNYVWNDKASKTPVDAWNHSLDALSYATRKELKSNTTNNLQQIASIL